MNISRNTRQLAEIQAVQIEHLVKAGYTSDDATRLSVSALQNEQVKNWVMSYVDADVYPAYLHAEATTMQKFLVAISPSMERSTLFGVDLVRDAGIITPPVGDKYTSRQRFTNTVNHVAVGVTATVVREYVAEYDARRRVQPTKTTMVAVHATVNGVECASEGAMKAELSRLLTATFLRDYLRTFQ